MGNLKEALAEGCILVALLIMLTLVNERDPDSLDDSGRWIIIAVYSKLAISLLTLGILQVKAVYELFRTEKPKINQNSKQSVKKLTRVIPLQAISKKPKRVRSRSGIE
eukprot:TRINITY_DN7035_c0_g1_i2.p1 TRINITY_DN7035_c0_g1~~TRINITY_DN7035_c0_g1_i2.p1  ORF type:complete len:122 (+),score=16.62 TRINITY_DN7035_c0_g1_i2:43-366(+)